MWQKGAKSTYSTFQWSEFTVFTKRNLKYCCKIALFIKLGVLIFTRTTVLDCRMFYIYLHAYGFKRKAEMTNRQLAFATIEF